MIRIDEIYENTFWPWLRNRHPGVRINFCDPFGRSDPDSVLNYGWDDRPEFNYTFFFDQEPIHLDLHLPTFDHVYHEMHYDITNFYSKPSGVLITSEKDSEMVETVCQRYGWKHFYYFFHGWAALDWYRGYDKTFLITPPEQRHPKRTFIAPNRIIGGHRKHRLLMLYHIFKNNLTHNWISCPAVCPAENIAITDIAKTIQHTYSDAIDVFSNQTLPIEFPGETGSPMHSCWLSLFDQSADSLLYLITETVAQGRRHHLTEKTFKPIAMGMPFVMISTAGSLEYLRSYGFKTFGDVWDESYDQETDDVRRIERVADLLNDLDNQTVEQRQQLFHRCLPVIEHNWNHFYRGGFEKVLWQELTDMLKELDRELCVRPVRIG